jgi:hypothetical protein
VEKPRSASRTPERSSGASTPDRDWDKSTKRPGFAPAADAGSDAEQT